MEKRFFPFGTDVKLTEVLAKSRFTLSAEVIPPRNGAEHVQVLEQIHGLIDAGAQFLAVTKGAGGSLRGGSLPIAQSVKEQFQIPCIAHFTCRDLTPAEVENQLMDHHYFGIRNILALRGDPPDGQPEWKAREGGYNYAHQLIDQIRNLNQGKYLARQGGPEVKEQTATDFCIGAAVYPQHPNEEERIRFFRQKVEAGAQFGITDMIFDAEAYAKFMDRCEKTGLTSIPVLPGSRLLKTKKQAERMMSKFKVSIPQEIYNSLPETEGPDSLQRSVDHFIRFVERLKILGAPGIHIFVIADTLGASAALRQLAGKEKKVSQ